MNISEKIIRSIADELDVGCTYFVNTDTGEYVPVMNDGMFAQFNIEDSDDIEKIDSWEHFIRIDKPDSNEFFNIMERFVNEVIPEGKLKERFWKALSKSHPFRNFNEIVHNSDFRESWFAFKQEALEKYVRRELGVSEKRELII